MYLFLFKANFSTKEINMPLVKSYKYTRIEATC